VVVAYNRRELLLECLQALHDQDRSLDAVVVVDNGSVDGTAEAVSSAFPSVDLVCLTQNTGGAGGFAIGIERALSAQRADMIWIMDDDTIPTPSALAALLRARSLAREVPAILASRVVWTDGRDHPMNTPRSKPFAAGSEQHDAALAKAMPVRSASFVSTLVDAAAVQQEGLPIAEYFIWNDDFEFTARILRRRRGLYVPASVVVHKTKARTSTDVDPGERFYYEVRNKLWLFRYSQALSPLETPLYVAATARRWLRTFRNSHDRSTLRRAFRSGWSDGIRKAPRHNATYLESLGLGSEGVSTFESPSG
jgi:GT2 family glycosyltransferase